MEEIGGGSLIPFRPQRQTGNELNQLIRRGVDEVAGREIGISPSQVVNGIKEIWDVGRNFLGGKKKEAEPIRRAIEQSAPRNMVVSSSASSSPVVAGNAISVKSGYSGAPRLAQMNHPAYGPGMRAMGTSIFTPITASPGSTVAFASVGKKPIDPRSLGYGNMLSAIADHYQTYKIAALTFRYVPACSTTTPGALKIAFSADGSEAPFDAMSYLTASQLPYSFAMAAWEPNAMTIAPVPAAYNQYFLWPAAGLAEYRQTIQGTLYGYWNGNRAEAEGTTLGMLEVDYVVDFWNPCPSQVGAPTLVSILSDMKLHQLRGAPVPPELKDRLARHMAAFGGDPDEPTVGPEPVEPERKSSAAEPLRSTPPSLMLDKRSAPFRA